jgi:hypothetical protein
MILKVAYNDESAELVKQLKEIIPEKFPLVELITYQEELFRERKKAFALKGEWGTFKSPFAILIDENKPVKAFYSEENECTFNKIIETLTSIIVY